MTTTPLWHEAAAFAARAHREHLRRDEGTPYFSHPARVAMIVAVRFGCDDETVLAAAFLHDVIEDTTTDYDDLLKYFGKDVAEIVACLSKDTRLIEPDREQRYDEQLQAGRWEARLIKLADVYDNFADAGSGDKSRHMLEKVDRAVKIAGEGPHIAEAMALVKQLAGTARHGPGST